MRFHLSSTGGRIGPFWWTNSTTTPVALDEPILERLAPRWILWGCCGWGTEARVLLQSIRP